MLYSASFSSRKKFHLTEVASGRVLQSHSTRTPFLYFCETQELIKQLKYPQSGLVSVQRANTGNYCSSTGSGCFPTEQNKCLQLIYLSNGCEVRRSLINGRQVFSGMKDLLLF